MHTFPGPWHPSSFRAVSGMEVLLHPPEVPTASLKTGLGIQWWGHLGSQDPLLALSSGWRLFCSEKLGYTRTHSCTTVSWGRQQLERR